MSLRAPVGARHLVEPDAHVAIAARCCLDALTPHILTTMSACMSGMAGHPNLSPITQPAAADGFSLDLLDENPDIMQHDGNAAGKTLTGDLFFVEFLCSPATTHRGSKERFKSSLAFTRDLRERCLVVSGSHPANQRVVLERVKASTSLRVAGCEDVLWRVGVESPGQQARLITDLALRDLNAFAFTEVRIATTHKVETAITGLRLEFDEVRGLSDSEMVQQVVEKGLLDPQYIKSFGWAPASAKPRLHIMLWPIIAVDEHFGHQEVMKQDDGATLYYVDADQAVPAVRISQPPAAVLFTLHDGTTEVYKRSSLFRHCKNCLDDTNHADGTVCAYTDVCRVCLSHLPSLPCAGQGHCCTQGVTHHDRNPAIFDPMCGLGESPLKEGNPHKEACLRRKRKREEMLTSAGLGMGVHPGEEQVELKSEDSEEPENGSAEPAKLGEGGESPGKKPKYVHCSATALACLSALTEWVPTEPPALRMTCEGCMYDASSLGDNRCYRPVIIKLVSGRRLPYCLHRMYGCLPTAYVSWLVQYVVNEGCCGGYEGQVIECRQFRDYVTLMGHDNYMYNYLYGSLPNLPYCLHRMYGCLPTACVSWPVRYIANEEYCGWCEGQVIKCRQFRDYVTPMCHENYMYNYNAVLSPPKLAARHGGDG
jgi:hypothetical protein